ncbi:MAG: hypothetical protein II605_01390 [Paludibacteraceae bacterium]|nr:hypothetical protein [Paludibacteraceae bacterium]MBQ2189710.1 hypothetical protein [Paludibacteraceae bacterium]MBQ4017876.1 hypothetical protein [Paludibacteraceae bacterium]
MARVDLPKGIVAIHGRVGNLIYRSRKQPDGSYRVFVHEAPSRKHNGPISNQHRTNIEPTT